MERELDRSHCDGGFVIKTLLPDHTAHTHTHTYRTTHACLITPGKNFNLSCNQFAQDNRTQSAIADGRCNCAGRLQVMGGGRPRPPFARYNNPSETSESNTMFSIRHIKQRNVKIHKEKLMKASEKRNVEFLNNK